MDLYIWSRYQPALTEEKRKRLAALLAKYCVKYENIIFADESQNEACKPKQNEAHDEAGMESLIDIDVTITNGSNVLSLNNEDSLNDHKITYSLGGITNNIDPNAKLIDEQLNLPSMQHNIGKTNLKSFLFDLNTNLTIPKLDLVLTLNQTSSMFNFNHSINSNQSYFNFNPTIVVQVIQLNLTNSSVTLVENKHH